MKSTYKLLSMQWDGLPIYKNFTFVEYKDTDMHFISNFYDDINLFDFLYKARKAKGSELIKLSPYELDKLKCIKECQQLLIVLDYFSKCNLANRLYLKRILQIATKISSVNNKIELKLVLSNTRQKEVILNIIDNSKNNLFFNDI